MRDHEDEIGSAGGRIVAVGTGDVRYAAAFVADTHADFTVLVDDDAEAANAAAIPTASWYRLLHPRTWSATRATSKRGYHVHKAGKRVKQLGATFVIGVGDTVRYAHIDPDSTVHAPVSEIVAALRDA